MSAPQKRPRLALHVCCGPCATAVIERLADSYDVTAVWYNPNVDPAGEHELRLAAMRTVAERYGVELVELEYDRPAWELACAGLMDEPEGGARCVECFRLRLERVARWAAAHEMDVLATTLTISPHKSPQIVNALLQEICRRRGIEGRAEDFKQRDGFLRSVQLSKEWGLYRQRWCGCAPGRQRARRAAE